MAEVGHDVLDDLFHAVEIAEGRVELDDLVGEDARQPRIEPGVDQLRLADGAEHAFGRGGIRHAVGTAQFEVGLQRHFFFAGSLEARLIGIEDGHGRLLIERCAAPRPAVTDPDCAVIRHAGGAVRLRLVRGDCKGAGSVAENGTPGASSMPGAVFGECSCLCSRPISCFRRTAGAVLESSTSFIVLTLAKCASGLCRSGIGAGGSGFFQDFSGSI